MKEPAHTRKIKLKIIRSYSFLIMVSGVITLLGYLAVQQFIEVNKIRKDTYEINSLVLELKKIQKTSISELTDHPSIYPVADLIMKADSLIGNIYLYGSVNKIGVEGNLKELSYSLHDYFGRYTQFQYFPVEKSSTNKERHKSLFEMKAYTNNASLSLITIDKKLNARMSEITMQGVLAAAMLISLQIILAFTFYKQISSKLTPVLFTPYTEKGSPLSETLLTLTLTEKSAAIDSTSNAEQVKERDHEQGTVRTALLR